MIPKFKYFSDLFRTAVKAAPVEMLVSLFFLLVAIVALHEKTWPQEWLWSFPACFFIIYAIGRWTERKGWRWIYYLSVVSVPGFWIWDLKFQDPLFLITLLISQLLVLLSWGNKDNETFVQDGLGYLRDVAGASLLALVGWVLASSIYSSFIYIFDLDYNYNFVTYAAQVAWIFVAPVFFLMFNLRRGKHFSANRFLRILSDFIVSPALLIYNLILYLYFIKIACLWSLPKGGIAYMVGSFVVVLFVMRGIQTVLKDRYYDWYYKRFSYWILPALIVLWISVAYRVGEYGWTIWRGYLFLSALLASVAMVLFFISRWGKYRVMVGITLGILTFFSYVPGVNVRQWEICSQTKRLKNAVRELYTEADKQWSTATDSLTFLQYNVLYHSSKYMQEVKGKEYMMKAFGFSYEDLVHIMPYPVWEKLENHNRGFSPLFFLINDGKNKINVRDYTTLEIVNAYQENKGIYYDFDKGELILMQEKDTLLKVNINKMFREKLVAGGIDVNRPVSKQQLQGLSSSIFTYMVGSRCIIFESIHIRAEDAALTGGRPFMLLTR